MAVFPLIFHSIKDEVPEASQSLVLRLYQLWLVLLATLILNLVACIFILLAGSEDGGRDLGASITLAHCPFRAACDARADCGAGTCP